MTDEFWELAEPLLVRPGVTRSTMMGFGCLRFHGDFFATSDHRTGELVVKLTEDRVEALVSSGAATNFAPAGTPFREWAAIPTDRTDTWPALLDEALGCAAKRVASR